MYSLIGLAAFAAIAFGGVSKNDELECMFLGYPDLEYDGFDRTEVGSISKVMLLSLFMSKDANIVQFYFLITFIESQSVSTDCAKTSF